MFQLQANTLSKLTSRVSVKRAQASQELWVVAVRYRVLMEVRLHGLPLALLESVQYGGLLELSCPSICLRANWN